MSNDPRVELESFRSEVRAWLEAEAPPWHRQAETIGWGRGGGHDREREWFELCRIWQRTVFDGGFAALTLPPKFGGRGLRPAHQIVYGEEASPFGVTSGFIGASLGLFLPALIRFGSPSQHERFLRATLRADLTWCQLFSEPEAGSDLAGLRCAAVRDDGDFVLNGQKLWTSSAQFCEWGFALVRTNPDVPKHQGITMLLLEMNSPGIEVRPLETIAGSRHFNEVFLTDVRVPADQVLGEVDRGWDVARAVLASESVTIGTNRAIRDGSAELVGLAQNQGRFEDPEIRRAVAWSYVEEQILEWLGDRLRDAIKNDRAPDVDGSVLKILYAEGRARRSDVALRILGDDALLAEDDAPAAGFWQSQMLDRYSSLIGGGTVEVHRNGIGERVLGLPREHRPDRDLSFRASLKKAEPGSDG